MKEVFTTSDLLTAAYLITQGCKYTLRKSQRMYYVEFAAEEAAPHLKSFCDEKTILALIEHFKLLKDEISVRKEKAGVQHE